MKFDIGSCGFIFIRKPPLLSHIMVTKFLHLSKFMHPYGYVLFFLSKNAEIGSIQQYCQTMNFCYNIFFEVLNN